jgi:DNA-binding NarL/FixJ family response regulator
VSSPLRIVIGEDDVLLREGIGRLLDDAGLEIVALTGDAEDLVRRTLALRPDVAVVDVQMPPGGEDGTFTPNARAARAAGAPLAGTGVPKLDSALALLCNLRS